MNFSGRNLAMVRNGIELAIAELHNQIATCPDVFAYADDLAAIEKEKAKLDLLLIRIDKRIAKEQRKSHEQNTN